MKKRDLQSLLEDKLKPKELKLVYKSYDVVGDIAIIRVQEKLKHHSMVIAEAVMQLHKNVKAVFRQSSAVAVAGGPSAASVASGWLTS